MWQKSTGFSAHFCDNCDCGVPNLIAKKYYWIPIGLLDVDDDVEVVAHFCLSSKSNWHQLSDNAKAFDELPDFAIIMQMLK